jgi:RNA polymerase sigma factor (sigma-70 family)
VVDRARVSSPKKLTGSVNITKYLPLVERVAKVEYRRIPSHMVDYEELVSIGAIAIQALLRNKTEEQIEKLNTSYMATATRWAIRNELRSRYKWYTLKHKSDEEETGEEAGAETSSEDGEKSGTSGNSAATPSPETVRETVYETILSIESIQEGSDGDTPYEFIKDGSATPEESLEIVELGRAIKKAIESLPTKERTIMEYRFYRNMQVKDIASLVGLSSSRITRIVQASLNQVRDYLKENNHLD